MDYHSFLKTKLEHRHPDGVDINPSQIHESLHPFQRDLVTWAAKVGRAALFADTGLGKTRMQIEWGRLVTDQTVLILAPLAVVQQTIREGASIGVPIRYSRDGDIGADKFIITNYERLDLFNPEYFGALVLDESSILKDFTSKTKKSMVEFAGEIPYRLA